MAVLAYAEEKKKENFMEKANVDKDGGCCKDVCYIVDLIYA